jgi:hypothetical protein
VSGEKFANSRENCGLDIGSFVSFFAGLRATTVVLVPPELVLESALQPAGVYAAYLNSALDSEIFGDNRRSTVEDLLYGIPVPSARVHNGCTCFLIKNALSIFHA